MGNFVDCLNFVTFAEHRELLTLIVQIDDRMCQEFRLAKKKNRCWFILSVVLTQQKRRVEPTIRNYNRESATEFYHYELIGEFMKFAIEVHRASARRFDIQSRLLIRSTCFVFDWWSIRWINARESHYGWARSELIIMKDWSWDLIRVFVSLQTLRSIIDLRIIFLCKCAELLKSSMMNRKIAAEVALGVPNSAH